MPSVEEALTALGYVRAPEDLGPWWTPPDPPPQALPGTVMGQPIAATPADALVFASGVAAVLATTFGNAPSLADDPDFAAAVEAAAEATTGRVPVLQAVALPGVLFADPPDFIEDVTEGDLPAFRLVLFTERQRGRRAESEMILVYDDAQAADQAHDELTARWDGPLAEGWLRHLFDVSVTVEGPHSTAAGLWTVSSRVANTIDPDDLGALPRTAYGRWLENILVHFDMQMLWP